MDRTGKGFLICLGELPQYLLKAVLKLDRLEYPAKSAILDIGISDSNSLVRAAIIVGRKKNALF